VTVVIDDNGLEQTEIDQDDMALLESDPAGAAYAQAITDVLQAAADAAAATTIDVEAV
jgi:hypothetical protein